MIRAGQDTTVLSILWLDHRTNTLLAVLECERDYVIRKLQLRDLRADHGTHEIHSLTIQHLNQEQPCLCEPPSPKPSPAA